MKNIELENISHRYGDHTVLSGFNFAFPPGQTTCLLGPSGCGKTTVLRLIAGLETPVAGSIRMNGHTVSRDGKILVPPHQRNVGFVFQDLALWSHFTVFENIAFGLRERMGNRMGDRRGDPCGRPYGRPCEEKTMEMLEFFGIAGHARKHPQQLSGGQKQMVAIARSLVLQPAVLLMDEPLANLDVQVKENILRRLQDLQAAHGFTMIYVTHDHRESLDLGQIVVVMQAGKIEQAGIPKALLHTSNTFVKSFLKIS